jgi:cold shock CspA family protein
MFDYDPRLSAHLKSLQPAPPKRRPKEDSNLMYFGTCVWFNDRLSYGFIRGDGPIYGVAPGDDIFVSGAAAALSNLEKGDCVEFTIKPSKSKTGKMEVAKIIRRRLEVAEAA